MANPYNKPNLLAPRSEKLKPEFGLKFGKYIVSRAIGDDFNYYKQRRDRIKKARAYAQGDQNNDIYKQIYNATGDRSPMNLDFTPLGIGSKYFNALVQDVMGEFDVQIRAIDPTSMSKRKAKRDELLGAYYSKDFLEEFESKTGIKVSKEMIIPDSVEEVDLHMNINYKQSVEIAMKQAVTYTLALNNYADEQRRLVAADIINGGKAVVKVELDPSYGIRTKYVDIENFISSETNSPQGDDLAWAGEIKWMTISDIRRISDLTEKQLQEIYQSHRGRWGNEKFYGDYTANFNNSNDNTQFEYFYDSLVVPVVNFCFKATDRDRVKVTKSKYGERRYIKSDEYETEYEKFEKELKTKKEVTEEDKEKLKKLKAKNVSVEEDVYESVYEGYHIADTDYVFNYGLMRNMVRPHKSLKAVELPYKVFATSYYNMTNKSPMEDIIPYIDQINIAHLKMQQVIARAMPQLTTINIDSWLEFSMGGKDWSPLELQDVVDATWTAYHKGTDENGQYVQPPIQSQALQINLEPYIATINHYMMMIRQTLGFTPEREGLTSSKQLVGVTELSIESSRAATYFINHAVDTISKKVVEDVCWRIQDIPEESPLYSLYEEAIGSADMSVISSMDEIALADFGIFVSTKPDNEEKLNLERDIQTHIANKELRIEDAMMVRKLSKSSGIDTAYQYMRVKRQKYVEEQMMREQQLKQMDEQRQLRSQQMAMQAKQMEQENEAALIKIREQSDTASNLSKLEAEYFYKSKLSRQEFEQDTVLKGVEDRTQLAKIEKDNEAKSKRLEEQARLTAKQKVEVDKVKDGRQTEITEENISTQNNNQLDQILADG